MEFANAENHGNEVSKETIQEPAAESEPFLSQTKIIAVSTKKENEVDHSATIIKKGILSKKGRGGLIRPWSLRTVILWSNCTVSYLDGKEEKGAIKIKGSVIRTINASIADGRPFAFEILEIASSKSHSLVLAAGSQEETTSWVEVLQKHAKQSEEPELGYVSFISAAKEDSLDYSKLKETLAAKKRAQEEAKARRYSIESEEG